MTLSPAGAYDPDAVISVLASHNIAGAEATDSARRTHSRHLVVAGRPVPVTLGLLPDTIRLEVHDRCSATEVAEIEAVVRRWLDLDTDLELVHAALGSDPALSPLLTRRRGLRITGCPDPFEGAVITVLGQQVSLAATRVFGARLVATAGEPGALGLCRFPSPMTLAAVSPDTLRRAVGITTARARTVQILAAAVADGLHLDPDGDHAGTRRELGALPGIGPWTIEYIALRCLGDRDAYPRGDRVLERALDAAGIARGGRAGEAWRPYRSYATAHLWAAAADRPDEVAP